MSHGHSFLLVKIENPMLCVTTSISMTKKPSPWQLSKQLAKSILILCEIQTIKFSLREEDEEALSVT